MIQSLRLQHYRSYTDETFEFDDGVNIVVGPNASGKTNLLEAIMVIARGASFRARDIELVQFQQKWARLDAKTPLHSRSVKIIVSGGGASKKEFIIDQQNYGRLSINKQLPLVLFEPSTLTLLHGSPDMRREYMDNLLSQISDGYTKRLRDYKRTLAQRNALLKGGQSKAGQLFAWNIRLSELGGRIATSRLELITDINNRLNDVYCSLAGSDTTLVSAKYSSQCRSKDYATSLLALLEARQQIDLERGYTTVGPHRDDLTLLFNGHGAAEFASRGETRTAILALKIIELSLTEKVFGQKPIVLLDDVFSELDGRRRQALTHVIKGYQTFITTTDADVVIQHFIDNCHIIPL